MRILFISHNFPPETNAPAVRTYENCRRWARMGHQVTVVTGPPNFPSGVLHAGYRNRWLQREEMDGIQVIRTWMYLAANEGFLRRIVNYLSFMITAIFASCFASPCDVVVGTSPQFFVGYAAWAVAMIRRRPFVFEVRDLWPESIVAVGAIRGGPIIPLLHAMARFLYRRAARIIVVTDAFQRVLEEYGVPGAKIAVVTNGVDLTKFTPSERQNAVREELGLNGHFVASYVGTLGMAHGLETLLDAAFELRAHDDIRFLIVGNGADRERLAIEHRKRDLPNVLMLEGQPHERMPEFLAASDACLVLLRRTDVFKTVLPSKIFEAMGAARPIILGVEGEAEAVVREGDCGVVVEPENSAQLAAAVRRLAMNPELCTRLGENGRSFADRCFDRDVLAGRYAEILTELCRPVPRPAFRRRVARYGVAGGEVRGGAPPQREPEVEEPAVPGSGAGD